MLRPSSLESAPVAVRLRKEIRVQGVVQGVGFRPAVCRLAWDLGLDGFVRNEGDAVRIEVEGTDAHVDSFLAALRTAAPALARVDAVEVSPVATRSERGFRVAPSAILVGTERAVTPLPPDLAPCDDCLRELADPGDRRHRYPLISCTACGPRFTITTALPYDRASTTMAAFPLCADCRREHGDPTDRRFHAEPLACPRCGPRLRFLGSGHELHGDDALDAATEALRAGAVLAVKGVGGYGLAVDATVEAAVGRLRTRKHRPHKPFAVMARDLAHARRIAVVDALAEALLASPARPIVLLPARPDGPLARGVAPGLDEVGVFLPPSPLQHLLAHEGPPLQVVTSGNVSREPIARDDDVALARLASVADAFVLHDRPIAVRCDDSVLRIVDGAPVPLRRARGFVPEAIALPVAGPPVLAVGGASKLTVCLAAGGRAVLSPHLGDLGGRDAPDAFDEAVAHLVRLVGVEPVALAHDLHPDLGSTRWAEAWELPRLAVAHHHAHVAACLAEHGRTGPVVGVAFDGTGLGPDGTLWGGEVLVADLTTCHRAAHLRPLRLPGGDAAIRSPWRLAVSALLDAGEPPDVPGVDPALLRGVVQLWGAGEGAAATGAGRWFDAVSALCGLCREATWDGQAAAALEAVAAPGPAVPYPLDGDGTPFVLDLRPALRAVVADLRRGIGPDVVSARWHETLAHAALEGCRRARAAGGPDTAALTGGCFQNRRLTSRLAALLRADGFEVLTHRRVPPNDGGLSLGQAAVATARLVAGT